MVVVLGLGDDLLVDELADHLEDGLLLVGLLVERGGDGHGREDTSAAVAWPRFARDVVEAAPPRNRALVELTRDGGRREWTFGEIATAAATFAARLDDHGLRRGDVVLTLVGNRSEWVLAMVACFRLGSSLPCTEQLRPKDLALRLRVARPRLVVCDERNADVLAAAGWDGPLWIPWGQLPAAPAPPHADLEPADPCLITFTSGTAGEPKAVLHGQRYLAARCCRRGIGSTRGRTTWCGAPPRPGGRSRPATRSSRRGCAVPPRSCTTRASTPMSGSSCSSASASTCCAWRRPSTA